MGRIGKRLFFGVAAAGLSGLFALTAVAAPPPRPAQAARPLDLSAPLHLLETPNKGAARASMPQASAFPQRDRFSQLESAPLPTQPTIQDRIRAFRREGFPVARLWESKTALLHLGLNQKGKPGLWIVQKTH